MYGYKLDWCAFTISSDSDFIRKKIINRLSEALAVNFKSAGGFNGYVKSDRSDAAIIAYGGRHQNGTSHIVLNGSGCSVLGWYGVAAFIRSLIRDYGVRVRFTRVDIALDCPGSVFRQYDSLMKVQAKLRDKRIKNISFVQSYSRDAIDGIYGLTGWTLYIGSRESERFCRVYKKRLDNGTPVTRFEYELKQRYAMVAGGLLLCGTSIQEAFAFANLSHLDISSTLAYYGYDIEKMQESLSASLPKKKEKDTIKWLMRIAGTIYNVSSETPATFAEILRHGSRISAKRGREEVPYSNTGVHFVVPKDVEYLHLQGFNYDTLGVSMSPFDRSIFS